MLNKISRRTFLKVTGAFCRALALLLCGRLSGRDNSSIEVKVGDKISNWNNLAVQLTSRLYSGKCPRWPRAMSTLPC